MDKEKLGRKVNIHDFPVSPDMHLRLAVRAYQDGQVDVAVREATLSLNLGEEHANCFLGFLYENVDSFRDYEKALFYYEQGVRNVGAVECWLGVARLNYLGLGVKQDYVRAFECYKIVVEDCNHPLAHLLLGKMYLDGEGVMRDYSRAKSHLYHAKKMGYYFANSYLATFYFRQKSYLHGSFYRLISVLQAIGLSFMKNKKQHLRRI